MMFSLMFLLLLSFQSKSSLFDIVSTHTGVPCSLATLRELMVSGLDTDQVLYIILLSQDTSSHCMHFSFIVAEF